MRRTDAGPMLGMTLVVWMMRGLRRGSESKGHATAVTVSLDHFCVEQQTNESECRMSPAQNEMRSTG